MIKGLHHIAIICSDYNSAKRFYIDVLGLELIREEYRDEKQSHKIELGLNGTYIIELFTFPNPPVRISFPEACGLRHLAFAVQDAKKQRQQLIDQGVECEPIRIDGGTQKQFFFCFDPDGLPIEFYQI